MGQAKRRGSFEVRQAAAIDQQDMMRVRAQELIDKAVSERVLAARAAMAIQASERGIKFSLDTDPPTVEFSESCDLSEEMRNKLIAMLPELRDRFGRR